MALVLDGIEIVGLREILAQLFQVGLVPEFVLGQGQEDLAFKPRGRPARSVGEKLQPLGLERNSLVQDLHSLFEIRHDCLFSVVYLVVNDGLQPDQVGRSVSRE